ncbi:E3 ubiquitin-protein ligase TRIM56-like [Gigantopelta aegis]|uniref:E3 ubiquitin-protein ligase TRIM56-like n=1 Tax=Gigantopelta aegis TaxID=1735272 RepID=UPI001B888BB9|nr:E3 ubiquitin-protein ligase TRIM56-like [Gigantopelta aegis]
MASTGEIADDFLLCSLCMEKYREPKTLPCLHTFCYSCLFTYVGQTATDAVFPCPLCGQETRQVGRNLSTEQWMETFTVNPFVFRLQKVSEMRQSVKACDVCRQEQVLVQAVHWCKECLEGLCEECERVHGRIRASREHHVVGMESLENEALVKLLRPRRGPDLCQEHRGKTLTHVCLNCKTVACDTCIAVFHQGCRKVEPSVKIVTDFRNDFCLAEKTLEEYFSLAAELSRTQHEQLDRLTKSKEEVISEITAFGQRLVNSILEKEQRLITEVDLLYIKHRDHMAENVWNSEVSVNSLAKTKQFVQYLTSYGSDMDVLNNYDVIGKQMQILKSKLILPRKRNEATPKFRFLPHKKASEILRSMNVLGEVVVTKIQNKPKLNKEQASLPAPPNPNLTPRLKDSPSSRHLAKRPSKNTQVPTTKFRLVSSFSGRCNSDTMKTDLRGILLLASGDFVVMDIQFRNTRLKKFGPRGKLISTLDPGECPHSLIMTSDSEAAVSLPKSREIAFVSLGGTLQICEKLKLSKQYYSLASSVVNAFVAVSISPPEVPTIDVVSFTGDVISSLPLDRVRYPTPPKGIAVSSKGEYLILFGGEESVVCLNEHGDFQYNFSPGKAHDVRREVGIQCNDVGNSYIVDAEAHKIHVVSDGGKYVGPLLGRIDGLRGPLAMCFSDAGRLALTQSNGDIKLFVVDQHK